MQNRRRERMMHWSRWRASERSCENLVTTLGDQHCVFEMCGEGEVICDYSPVIIQLSNACTADRDNWFDGNHGIRREYRTRSCFPKIWNIGELMECIPK